MMRLAALAALLPMLAVAPIVTPAAAQEACTTWSAEMQEDEGGSVLTASACALDRPDVFLSLNCFNDTIWIRYDLALTAEASPELAEETEVVFKVGDASETLPVIFQEMDARHAGETPVAGPLVKLLKSGERLSIVDVPGKYPVHEFSLKGSSAAIDKLVAGCGS
jgi:hypothetical protein